MKVILIDSGTTNSRIRLIDPQGNELIDSEKIQVGVRNTAIDGNNKMLRSHLRKGITVVLERNGLKPKDILYVVASGMITSNLGLYEVPHIVGPAGIEDFVENSVVVQLEEFNEMTFIFIPGMKNEHPKDDGHFVDSLNEFDIMRGEEVEVFGLLKQFNRKGKGVIVLPGSHTKFIIVDDSGLIDSSVSTLGGETLFAIHKETILSDSFDQQLIRTIDQKMLDFGYEAAEKYGLTRSLYHIRLQQILATSDENERANYFVGSVVYEDIQALLKSINYLDEIRWVIVGGSDPLKSVFSYMLTKTIHEWEILKGSDDEVEQSLILGAQEVAEKVYENQLKLNNPK